MLMGHGKKTTAKSETGNFNQLFTGAADGEKNKYVACLLLGCPIKSKIWLMDVGEE